MSASCLHSSIPNEEMRSEHFALLQHNDFRQPIRNRKAIVFFPFVLIEVESVCVLESKHQQGVVMDNCGRSCNLQQEVARNQTTDWRVDRRTRHHNVRLLRNPSHQSQTTGP